GVDVCRQLRQASSTTIIVVTAHGEEADRVLALDEGADDYLVKPFGLAELLARIRAVLRRGQQADGKVVQHRPLTVDMQPARCPCRAARCHSPRRNSPSSSAWSPTPGGW